MPIVRYWFSNAGCECALGSGQFEGEDEICDFLEAAAQGAHLADDVLQTDDVTTQVLLNLRVRFYLHAFFAHLAEKLLVDQFADQLLGWLSPSNVVLYLAQLLDVRRGAPHESTSIDASQAQLAQDDLLLLGDVGHSPHSHHKQQLANTRYMHSFNSIGCTLA